MMTDKNRVQEAEVNEEAVKGVENYTFKRPLVVNGQTYKTITFNFENLNAEDMAAASAQLLSEGIAGSVMFETNKVYLLCLAARAAKMNYEDLKRASIKDGTAITLMMQNFLLL